MNKNSNPLITIITVVLNGDKNIEKTIVFFIIICLIQKTNTKTIISLWYLVNSSLN